MKRYLLQALLAFVLPCVTIAQTPGLIVKPAAGPGITPLNPNGDGYISAGTGGFTSNDVLQSEIQYKLIPPAVKEPTSDIQRGPNTLFTDLVQYVDGSGFYVFNDGTNILFRLRLGSIVSGSKGYSILIDTDQKIGNTGTTADPNYIASTSMNNGNPGFELEVTLETNFRVAIYNVDGLTTPTLVTSYPVATHSQTGVALSLDSGTPDYFYDFYVPLAALGISSTTPVRFAATTVMAPQSAIGGPKSDVFGVDDQAAGGSMNGWTSVITNQVAFTLNDLTLTGTGVAASRTAPPVINNTVAAGSNKTVSGTWTSFDPIKPSPAKIYLYKNGILTDSVMVATGNTWSISIPTIAVGDVFYAHAIATGESISVVSNQVVAAGCSPATTTATTGLAFSCITRKGMKGNRALNTSIKLYLMTSAGSTLVADDNSTTYKITYPTTTTWFYDGAGGGGSDPCTSASNDIADGSYALTATTTGSCESGVIISCQSLTATANPTITQSSLTTASTTISGTAVTGSLVRLFKNRILIATTTATSSSYSFSGLTLALRDTMEVYAQAASNCISAAAMQVVSCNTSIPFINTDNFGNLTTTATSISGTSFQPTGTTIRLYENAVLIGTTTVGSNYTWSVTYTPVATRVYTATAQNSTCNVSAVSTGATALGATTTCPSITGSYSSKDTLVSGTLPGSYSGIIRLYQDGIQLGADTVTASTAWKVKVNRTYLNAIYPGGVLTVTAQTSGSAERTGCSSTTTVGCQVPSIPILNTTMQTIKTGQSASFSITNSDSSMLYSITNSATGQNEGISKFSSGGVLSISTLSYSSPGTYNVVIKGTNLAGSNCESMTSASIVVNTTLPLKLISFNAHRSDNQVELKWVTEKEINVEGFDVERSIDGRNYEFIAHVTANGSVLKNTYETVDSKPPVAKVLYYRLRMTDIDRHFEFSSIVKIMVDTHQAATVSPNPFMQSFTLSSYRANKEIADIIISTVNGNVVYRKSIELLKGTNLIQITPGNLTRGMYFMRIHHRDASVDFLKIIKQ